MSSIRAALVALIAATSVMLMQGQAAALKSEGTLASARQTLACILTKYGPFGSGTYPEACWRPYSDTTSPFNRQVPSNPSLLTDSADIVSTVRGWDTVQNLLVGHTGTSDYWHPVYYSTSLDPLYTVECTQWISTCEVHGDSVRLPLGAEPAGGGDGHLSVIDQQTGTEYSFWEVSQIGSGIIRASHGGKTQIDGDGLGSNATAAHFGLAAGMIRVEEILGGEIDHALFAMVKCTSGSSVYPADPGTSGSSCANYSLPTQYAPPLGARLWLDMTNTEIDALAVPAWKKVVLKAMAKYGMIVGDTMGGNSSFAIQAESAESHVSIGRPNPWDDLGTLYSLPTYGGAYLLNMENGVPWSTKLKVLDPCVSAGTC